MTITIDEFVSREILCCVSTLIFTLTQDNKLEEDYWHLWEAVDWDEAELAIEDNNCLLQQEDDLWGVFDTDLDYYTIEPRHGTKHEAIRAYFDDKGLDITEYSCEVLEHWLCTNWLGEKLKAKGETVEEDFMGLVIWGRCTSGMGITSEPAIKEIYDEFINS
jgi:hypothetical protein